MWLKPGTMYRCLVDVPLWAKEHHLDTGEYELFNRFEPLTYRSINCVESGSVFMYVEPSRKQPYTHKVFYEDQAGWIFFGSTPIENCVEEITDDSIQGE